MDKICKDCNKSLNKELHFKNRRANCNDCYNKKRRELRRIQKPHIKEREELEKNNQRRCKYCKEILNLNNFRFNRLKCSNCEKKDGREYRQSDIGKNKAKTWSDNNKDHHHKLQAQWFQNNKTNINKRVKERKEQFPELKMISNYRSRLSKVINKEYKSNKYLNCTWKMLIEYFKYYLDEFENFTFDNYGTVWHIDHVIPLGTLDQSDKDNHWSLQWINLAPLGKKENLIKNKYIIKSQIKHHIKCLQKFIIIKNIEQKQIEPLLNHIATHLKMSGTSLEL